MTKKVGMARADCPTYYLVLAFNVNRPKAEEGKICLIILVTLYLVLVNHGQIGEQLNSTVDIGR